MTEVEVGFMKKMNSCLIYDENDDSSNSIWID